MRYHVVSRRGGPDHLVDLAEFGGNGQCSCENFRFSKQPLLARGAYPQEYLECWHIKQAARAFRFDMIKRILAARGDRENQ